MPMAEESAQQPPPSGPLAGEPRQRGNRGQPEPAARHRAATWLAWWVLLMSLWVAVDDSLQSDELLAGAGAAALAALAAEIASHQAATRFEIRAGWLARAFRLPGEVAHDTWIVFAANWFFMYLRAVHQKEKLSLQNKSNWVLGKGFNCRLV